jgi:Holliday junction resolvase RusA-like endonuclease
VTLTLTIPGEPVAKGRPRLGRGGRTFTPAKTARYEATVAMLARAVHQGRPPIAGAVEVTMLAVWPRPKSRPETASLQTWRTGAAMLKATRPDCDNVAKAILDGLQAGGVITDDGQVVRLVVVKHYAAKGEGARVEVRVESVGWPPGP